jgi:hypothetical protein
MMGITAGPLKDINAANEICTLGTPEMKSVETRPPTFFFQNAKKTFATKG